MAALSPHDPAHEYPLTYLRQLFAELARDKSIAASPAYRTALQTPPALANYALHTQSTCCGWRETYRVAFSHHQMWVSYDPLQAHLRAAHVDDACRVVLAPHNRKAVQDWERHLQRLKAARCQGFARR